MRPPPPAQTVRLLLPLPPASTGTTSTRRTEPQTKGVSMKALMKEASKGKPG